MEKTTELISRKIIFFDGVCHLCNAFVDAALKRDRQHRLLFAPLQGKTAEQILATNDRINLDTIVFFEEGKIYYKSSAILKIFSALGGFYKIICLAWIIPGPLRDRLYSFIARNRYSWFGKRDHCRLPTPEEKSYLLP
ncbi:MAG: thiol-disulfide oxidoreductase DCC family protein [Pseudobdellovibrionaceae bacterium]